jgi:flagellar protein FlgJ
MFGGLAIPPPLPQGPSPGALPSSDTLARARAGDAAARAEVERAAAMLEAHFATWLLREMRRTVPEGGLLPRGPAQDIYEQMLDDALAQAIARGRGLGLAEALKGQLLRQPHSAPSHDTTRE